MAAMTFLEGVQRLRRETRGVAGAGQPTSVESQTGQLQRLVDYYSDAWENIQNSREDWRWMRKPFTVNTVAGTEAYAFGSCTDTEAGAVISRFSRWYRHSIKAYLQSTGVSGEYPLRYIEWDLFRRIYHYGTQNNGQPAHVSIDPNNKLCLGPKPDAVYVVGGDFQRSAQILAEDDDEPEMPDEYHMLIVWDALRDYGLATPATEAYVRGETQGKKIRRRLERKQLPPVGWGDALA